MTRNSDQTWIIVFLFWFTITFPPPYCFYGAAFFAACLAAFSFWQWMGDGGFRWLLYAIAGSYTAAVIPMKFL